MMATFGHLLLSSPLQLVSALQLLGLGDVELYGLAVTEDEILHFFSLLGLETDAFLVDFRVLVTAAQVSDVRRAASAALTPTHLLVAAGLKRQRLSAVSTRVPGTVTVETRKWHREADVLARHHLTTRSRLRFVGPDGQAAETAAREHWVSVLIHLLAGTDMGI